MLSLSKHGLGVTIFALAMLAGCTAPPPPPAAINAVAIAYAQPDPKTLGGISAALALPPMKSNASWYATWLMLLPSGNQDTVEFAQVGVIRRPGINDNAAVFISYRYPGKALHYEEFPKVRVEPQAKATILVDGGDVRLLVGARALFHERIATLFPKSEPLYYQLGDEVSTLGDRLSGTFADVRLRTPAAGWRAFLPDCGYRDGGLTFSTNVGEIVGSGAYQSESPKSYFTLRDGKTVRGCKPEPR